MATASRVNAVNRSYHVVLISPSGPTFLCDDGGAALTFTSPGAARGAMRGHMAEDAWSWYVVGFDALGGIVEHGKDAFGTG